MNIHKVSTYYTIDELMRDLPDDNALSGDAIENTPDIEETYQSYKDELNQELKTTDRAWLELSAENCRAYGKAAKSILYRIIKSSVDNPMDMIAAANAITILKVMRVSLSSLDLQGVQIQGADLSKAILDDANFSNANLRKVNLTNASLNGTILRNANLTEVEWGLSILMNTSSVIRALTVSSSGKFAIVCSIDKIQIWDIEQQIIRWEFISNTVSGVPHIVCIDDRFFIIGDNTTIHIYDIMLEKRIETNLYITMEHSASAYMNFVLSPDKKLLAIAKSYSGYSEITVQRIERKDDNTPSLSEVIKKISKAYPYMIDKMFFSTRRRDLLITIGNSSNSIVFFDLATLEVTRVIEIENISDVEFCDLYDNETLLALIRNTVYTIPLGTTNKIVMTAERLVKASLFEESSPIKFFYYLPDHDCVLYIKDSIDSCPSICVRSLRSTSQMARYVYDAFNRKVDKVYVSEDSKLLFQISSETGAIYVQSIESIITRIEDMSPVSLLSHISFSSSGQKIFVLGKNDQTKHPALYRYHFLNGSLVSDLKEFGIIDDEEMKSVGSVFNYSLSGDGKFLIFKKKKALNKQSSDQKLQSLEYQLQLISLNEASMIRSKTFGYSTAMGLSYDGQLISFIDKGQIEIWDIKGEKLFTCSQDMLKLGFDIEEIKLIAIAPNFTKDGGYIACATQKTIKLVQLSNVHKMPDNIVNEIQTIGFLDKQIYDLKFIQDGLCLVSIGKNLIMIKDIGKDSQPLFFSDEYGVDKEELEDLFKTERATSDISSNGKYFLTCHRENKGVEGGKSLYNEKKYNILDLYDLKTGTKICQKEIIPGPICLKFSPKDNLFVTWLSKGDSIHMWHYTNRIIRLLWRSKSNLETYKLDISKAVGLAEHIRKRLIDAGAIDRS